jgi:hypothetical protein
MLFFLLSRTFSFDLKPLVETVWNMEVYNPNIADQDESSQFYHFNLTEDPETKRLVAEVFTGDCQIEGRVVTVGGDSVAHFEVELTDGYSGIVCLTDPSTVQLTKFKFVDTFDDLLGAYGVFNSSLTYSANLVNRATLHVSLFSFEKDIFWEVIFTRFFILAPEPWYSGHPKSIAVALGFAVAILGLITYDRLTGKDNTPLAQKRPGKAD